LERALTLPKLPKLQNLDRKPLAVVVLGPTASGKTALALAIARRFRGEIVNCDSVAMYREFEIGTAKASAAERAEVPHHLLDCVDPLADVSAGEYARQARLVLREIVLRENVLCESGQCRPLPIVSGGTGLYLRALLEGLFPGPQRSEELRKKLRGRAEKDRAPASHPAAARRFGSEPHSRQRHSQGDPGDRGVPGLAPALAPALAPDLSPNYD
jgi:tRNA A37 N6-isopentenylltransferase MiaA